MAGSDFVNIELSAAGLQMAGAGGAVRVTARHINYSFAAGATTRVLTSEWSKMLSVQTYQGQPIFQLAVAAPAADPETTLNTLKAEESALEAQIASKGGK